MKAVSGLLAVVGVLLTACQPTVQVQTVEVPGPTQVVTATPTPTATPGPATLVICQDAEPETLYLYGGSLAARNILEAIYDGPVDHRSYDFQPVILEKLPSLEDGDAYFDPVTVKEGDRVMDITGQPVELQEGTPVFPSHTCLDAANPECIATFDGTTPIEMEQMVVSWQLLEGVAWSDGEPVTADDSVYSYELACHPDTPSSKYLCERTASYVAAGERTVVWTGLPGYVDDQYILNFFSPLPRHSWQREHRYTAGELVSQPESARRPIGWGAFMVSEWVQGEQIVLERNPYYFRAEAGLPRVERVIFRFARDANDLVSRLLAGQCDIGLLEGEPGPLMPFLVAAQEQGLLNLVTSSSDTWEHLEFGINPVRTYNRPDFFEDVRVRQAIAHCIDRQAMADEITFGLGQVADSYVPPQHPLYAGSQLTRWEYDPESGRALLAEVGWTDEDGDGFIEAHGVEGIRTGTPFHVSLLTVQGDRQQETLARIIRSNLADCGIQLDLAYAPSWDLFADGPTGPLFGRQFDLAVFAWYNDVEPPCGLYLTEQIPDQGNWGLPNASGFSNEEYDAACRAALAALPGTIEYARYHAEVQRIFSEELPALPLLWRLRVALAQSEAIDFALDPSEESELWGIEEIGLAP